MKRFSLVVCLLLLALCLIAAAPSGPQFKLTTIGHAVYVDASESGQVIASIVLPDGSKVTGRDTAYWRAIDYGDYTVSVADSQGRVSTQNYTLSSTDGLCFSTSLNGTGRIDTEVRLRVQNNYAEAYFRTIVPEGAVIYIPNTHIDPTSMAQQEGQYSMVQISDTPTLVRLVNDKYVSMRGVAESGNVVNFSMLFLFPGQINVDLNGDGIPDINLDNDGDNVADTNIDDNDDGVVDRNPGVWEDPSSSSSAPSSSLISSSSSKPHTSQSKPKASSSGHSDPFEDYSQGQPYTASNRSSSSSSSSPSSANSVPKTYDDISSSSEESKSQTSKEASESQPIVSTISEVGDKVVFTLPVDSAVIDAKKMADFLREGRVVEIVVESPSSQATFNSTEGVPEEYKAQSEQQLNDLISFLDSRELVTGKELNEYVWGQALNMLDTFSNNPVAQTEIKSNPSTGMQ